MKQKQWEYLIDIYRWNSLLRVHDLYEPDNFKEWLHTFGEMGWELVSVRGISDFSELCIFKREVLL